jgi:hypothetical protein
MSRETLQHLNSNVLIGNTDACGTAWHYRADQQGDEANHNPGFVPVADVHRRLFFWEAESRRLAVEVPAEIDTMTHLSLDGHMKRWVELADKQAISRSDDTEGSVMGIFAPGYVMHQYKEWLLTQVANILDDTLGISSAGLLKGGAIAWVEVWISGDDRDPGGRDLPAQPAGRHLLRRLDSTCHRVPDGCGRAPGTRREWNSSSGAGRLETLCCRDRRSTHVCHQVERASWNDKSRSPVRTDAFAAPDP